MKKIKIVLLLLFFYPIAMAQINTEQVMRIGQNALYFEDYMLSIQYFNLVVQAKPEQAKPYFFRAIAKFNLEDFRGAEEDATMAIERNPFLNDVYEVRGVARQNLGKYNEAICDYNKALETLPYNKQILFNKAVAQEELQNYEASDSTFKFLLRYNPKYDRAYRGRAKLRLSQGDTVSAIANLDTVLKLNKNVHEAYAMRAGLLASFKKDYQHAYEDMCEAIKLQPQQSEYYVIRAQVKYGLDDYDGALDDYSLAIELNKKNYIAYYNRAILRTEINDINRAIEDFSVVLQMKPTDYRTLYNRAVLYRNIGEYNKALADITKVIEVLPDFAVAHFLRYEIYDKMGSKKKAEEEYDKSIALVKKLSSSDETKKIGDPFARAIESNDSDVEEIVAKHFSAMLEVESGKDIEQQYNNKDIRGSVQNRDVLIEPEPMFVLSYYTTLSELDIKSNYIKEVDEINFSRMLRFNLIVTNRETILADESVIKEHFESIEYYNSYLSSHTPRAIDYFGRALDFSVTRNYKAAIADLDRAIAINPDFVLAYFLRAIVKYSIYRIEKNIPIPSPDKQNDLGKMIEVNKHAALESIVSDWDKLISLQPRMAIAYYNKANTLLEMTEYHKAIEAYNNAIKIEPTMGEAYYNRGYIYLKLGYKDSGIADLSKAGELGIIPSYNLLKRLTL